MRLLDQSLCLLSGVSHDAELRLRRMGILACRQLAGKAGDLFSAAHAGRIRESFVQFETASRLGLAEWFVGHLPPGHRVRALPGFADDVLYCDIETDGMSRGSRISCVTTWRRGRLRTFVRGRNLDGFLEEWSAAKLLVGFNSKRFDTPMLCREFGLAAAPAQIDLMDEAAHYGLRGGLKAIEKKIGFPRAAVPCNDGAAAVEFWCRFRDNGDEEALSALLAYNCDDVLSLRHLARHLLELSVQNM